MNDSCWTLIELTLDKMTRQRTIMTRHINVMCTKSSISVNPDRLIDACTQTEEGGEAQGQPNRSMPGADGAQVPCSRA